MNFNPFSEYIFPNPDVMSPSTTKSDITPVKCPFFMVITLAISIFDGISMCFSPSKKGERLSFSISAIDVLISTIFSSTNAFSKTSRFGIWKSPLMSVVSNILISVFFNFIPFTAPKISTFTILTLSVIPQISGTK